MLYRIAADLVVIIHLIFILFAVLGALAILYKRWFIWLHVPAMLWAAAISFGGWICPLTPLENTLRNQAGQRGYDGGFVEHYIIPLIYPESYTRDLAFMLGLFVLGINLLIYGIVCFRSFRKPS